MAEDNKTPERKSVDEIMEEIGQLLGNLPLETREKALKGLLATAKGEKPEDQK